MVRKPLQFQRDTAQGLCARRRVAIRQRLERLAVGRRVADRRVARQRSHVKDRARSRAADQRALDAAMLVAERDFEVEDLLAVALEPEMAGLDDARVDRADRDLMDLLAADLEKFGDARAAAREPDRLQPRMTFRPDAPLLRDFALEQLRLRTFGRQRGIRILYCRGRYRQASINAKYSQQPDAVSPAACQRVPRSARPRSPAG